MNDLQAAQFNILKELDRIFTKHNVPYSLAYGTALGAVRHKGFIPWDDDIDLIMMRKDFERLESIWEEESPGHIFLQTYKSDPFYPYPFAKVRNSRTTFIEEGCDHLDINHGVFVDIFLFDYLPSNMFQRFKQLFYAELIWILTRKHLLRKSLKGYISAIICAFFSKESRLRCIRKFEKKMGEYLFDNAIGVVNLNYGTGWAHEIYPRDLLINVEPAVFEDGKFLLMKDYDSFLKIRYGDYMTPPPPGEARRGHPFTVCDVTKPYSEGFKKW